MKSVLKAFPLSKINKTLQIGNCRSKFIYKFLNFIIYYFQYFSVQVGPHSRMQFYGEEERVDLALNKPVQGQV